MKEQCPECGAFVERLTSGLAMHTRLDNDTQYCFPKGVAVTQPTAMRLTINGVEIVVDAEHAVAQAWNAGAEAMRAAIVEALPALTPEDHRVVLAVPVPTRKA